MDGENANGMWKDAFCCVTWGKKVGAPCQAEELPSDGPGQENE